MLNRANPLPCTEARAALITSVLKARAQAATVDPAASKRSTPSTVLKAVQSAYSVPGLRAWAQKGE